MSYNDKKVKLTKKKYNAVLDEFYDAVSHLEIPIMEPENPFNLTFGTVNHIVNCKDESLDNYLNNLVEKYGSDESLFHIGDEWEKAKSSLKCEEEQVLPFVARPDKSVDWNEKGYAVYTKKRSDKLFHEAQAEAQRKKELHINDPSIYRQYRLDMISAFFIIAREIFPNVSVTEQVGLMSMGSTYGHIFPKGEGLLSYIDATSTSSSLAENYKGNKKDIRTAGRNLVYALTDSKFSPEKCSVISADIHIYRRYGYLCRYTDCYSKLMKILEKENGNE